MGCLEQKKWIDAIKTPTMILEGHGRPPILQLASQVAKEVLNLRKRGKAKTFMKLQPHRAENYYPAKGRCWAATPERYYALLKDNRIWFGHSGNNVPAQKKFLSEVQDKDVAKTIWMREEVGDNQAAKREVSAFNNDEIFSTPKPEKLLERHPPTSPPTPATSSSTPSSAPAPPPPSRTKWAAATSALKWATTPSPIASPA